MCGTWHMHMHMDLMKTSLIQLHLTNTCRKMLVRCTMSWKDCDCWFNRKEYQKIAVVMAIGFAVMGFIGFFVKLIHIPINNIIVGS